MAEIVPITDRERERRFLVTDFEHDILARKHQCLVQGYFEITDDHEFRVRITDGVVAEFTAKRGSGMDRAEPKHTPPLPTARWVLEQTLYRVTKERRVIDGFEFDRLLGPLEGIFLVEREGDDVDVNLEKPNWINSWIEVTDSISNRTLARLAYEREHGDDPMASVIRNLLPSDFIRLVLTGAPCCGKSTMLQLIKERYGDDVLCVPEMASLMMEQLDMRPPDDGDKQAEREFQRQLGFTQQSFEAMSYIDATKRKRKLVVLDRGIADNAAYLSRGDIAPLAKLLRTSPQRLYSRYDRVIQLGLPSEKIYERHRRNNLNRKETYEQACELDRYITDAWSGHAHYRVVNEADWDAKVASVFRKIDKLLAA
jgi:CYTH domain-containing protein/predicted ATPase